MVTNSILRLFLMFSILVIMAGILLIVYIQFDRGYVVMGFDPDYEREQQNLITHVYQNQLQASPAATQTHALQPRKTVMVVEPAAQQAPAMTPAPVAPPTPPAPSSTSLPPAIPTVSSQPRRLNVAPPEGRNQIEPEQQPTAVPTEDYYTLLLRHNPWSPHYQPGKQ